MRVLIIALVAGCATHHAHAEPPVAPVVAVPAQPVYVQGLDPQLAQDVAYSAAYRAQWAVDHGAVPGAKSPVIYVSPGTVATASGGTVKCPATLAEIDTLEERVACLEADVDYLVSTVGVK